MEATSIVDATDTVGTSKHHSGTSSSLVNGTLNGISSSRVNSMAGADIDKNILVADKNILVATKGSSEGHLAYWRRSFRLKEKT